MQAETTLVLEQRALQYWERLRVYLPAAGMALSRGGAVGVQLLVQMAVGGLAGPAGLGLLQLFTSWTCILGEVLARGLPAYSMRVISTAWAGGRTGQCRGELMRSAGMVIRAGVLVAVPVGALSLMDYPRATDGASMDAGATLLAVVIAAPLFALLRLGAEALKSVDLPLPAVVLESLLAPGVVLLVCAGCWALDRPLDVPVLLLAGVAGYAVASVAVGCCLQARLAGHRPGSEPLPVAGTQLGALWATSVFSIVFLHLPFMLLPLFASVSETGIFAVAYKLVNVITTLLLLFAAVFGPAFARAAAAGDVRGLRSLLWRTQYLSLAVFTPMVGILLLSADWLTELFSLPAGSMGPIMLALLAGQLVNAATGLPGVMLNMAGAAGRELATLLCTLLLAGMAAPFVGAAFGAEGIAWLFSALLAFKNLVSYFAACHFLNELEIRA